MRDTLRCQVRGNESGICSFRKIMELQALFDTLRSAY